MNVLCNISIHFLKVMILNERITKKMNKHKEFKLRTAHPLIRWISFNEIASFDIYATIMSPKYVRRFLRIMTKEFYTGLYMYMKLSESLAIIHSVQQLNDVSRTDGK